MARGRKTALIIRLAADERHTLMAWQRSTTIPAGRARRGRIILLVADGVPISHIADTVGISRRFVYKWAKRFLQYGVDGLTDKPGRGIHLKRDSQSSITYSEKLNSGKSSATLQSTDRHHGIVGQKRCHFQRDS
jgi:hypothetical protein